MELINAVGKNKTMEVWAEGKGSWEHRQRRPRRGAEEADFFSMHGEKCGGGEYVDFEAFQGRQLVGGDREVR